MSARGSRTGGQLHGPMAVVMTATAAGQLLTAGGMVIVARSGTVRDLGQAVAVIAATALGATLLNFGSNARSVREIASGREHAEDFAVHFRDRTVVAAVAAILAQFVLLVLAPDIASIQAAPLLVVLIATSQMALVPLTAGRQFARLSLATMADKACFFALTAAWTWMGGPSPEIVGWAMSCGALVSASLGLALWPRRLRSAVASSLRGPWTLQNPWRGSRHFGVASILASVSAADVTLLGLVAGPFAAGIYGAVNRWTQPLNLAASAYAQTQYPAIAAAATDDQAWRRTRSAAHLLLPIGLALALIFWLAPHLVQVILGPQFASSALSLRLLAVGTFAVALNQGLVTYLNARGGERFVSWAFAGSITAQFALLAALAPILGATAAAVANCASQFILLAALAIGVRLLGLRRHRGPPVGGDRRPAGAVS